MIFAYDAIIFFKKENVDRQLELEGFCIIAWWSCLERSSICVSQNFNISIPVENKNNLLYKETSGGS